MIIYAYLYQSTFETGGTTYTTRSFTALVGGHPDANLIGVREYRFRWPGFIAESDANLMPTGRILIR
jgi:hypothetical protein